MAVGKPKSVEADALMSAKWDEIVAGRDFKPGDAPALTRLCRWYLIADRCVDDISATGEVQVAYSPDGDHVVEFPQIGTLQKAETAIRGIEKSLGIYGERGDVGSTQQTAQQGTVLSLVQGNRSGRLAKTA